MTSIPCHRRAHRACLLLCGSALVVLPSAALAEDGQHELLFFLSAEASHEFDVDGDPPERDEFLPTVDVLYSYTRGRFRALGEYILSSEENELERFQIGWQLGSETVLWLGRFHLPTSYWNTEYHHGQFLQTSISRPAIELWEDEGGVVPAHSVGLLLESALDLPRNASLKLAASAGTGVEFLNGELEPFNLLDPVSDMDELMSLRVAFLPDSLGESQMGLLAEQSLFEGDEDATTPPVIAHVRQRRIGAYVDWKAERWRLLGSAFYVRNRTEGPCCNQSTPHDSFTAAYLQGELRLDGAWLGYARFEDLLNGEDSPYLALHDDFIRQRSLLGLRWDVTPRQALTLELSAAETATSDYKQVSLQWSAVLP